MGRKQIELQHDIEEFLAPSKPILDTDLRGFARIGKIMVGYYLCSSVS